MKKVGIKDLWNKHKPVTPGKITQYVVDQRARRIPERIIKRDLQRKLKIKV